MKRAVPSSERSPEPPVDGCRTARRLWRRSSHSVGQGNRVEVAMFADTVHVRNTKLALADFTSLAISRDDWLARLEKLSHHR
jgi:hypothetical protein